MLSNISPDSDIPSHSVSYLCFTKLPGDCPKYILSAINFWSPAVPARSSTFSCCETQLCFLIQHLETYFSFLQILRCFLNFSATMSFSKQLPFWMSFPKIHITKSHVFLGCHSNFISFSDAHAFFFFFYPSCYKRWFLSEKIYHLGLE